MNPKAYKYLTKHAVERILQRTNIAPEWVDAAVRGKRAINIGPNPDDASTELLVFYNIFSESHYILIQDIESKLIITILFQDSARWTVDREIIARAKERMEELKMIKEVRQEWKQERKPSPKASPEEIQSLLGRQKNV